MVIGVTLLVVSVIIIAIWVLVEIKRWRHKFFAILLILFIVFVYVSFALSLSGQKVDLKTAPGVIDATKHYFSWLSSIFFGNLRSITTNAVKMNWKGNQTD